jgi:hypothetical protein
LIVWFFCRKRIVGLLKSKKEYEEQLKQVNELGRQLQQQLEQKDQTICRFISQLNRIGPGNEKRTIISIKKFDSEKNDQGVPIKP